MIIIKRGVNKLLNIRVSLQTRPVMLSVARSFKRRQKQRTILNKACEWSDLYSPIVLRTYKDILLRRKEEKKRIKISPSCCPLESYNLVQNWYFSRTSHGQRLGYSRPLRGEMIWDYPWVCAHLQLEEGMQVADIGTENSCLPYYFALRGCTVYGLDKWLGNYGESFLKNVLWRCYNNQFELLVDGDKEVPCRVVYRQEDVTKMSFPDCSFDRIICLSTLEHIPDDSSAARSLGRVLKSNGILAITVPLGPSYSQESDKPHRKGPNGKWFSDLGRVYSEEALFSRIIEPSGLHLAGDYDFNVDWSNIKKHQCPGQNPKFVSAVIFLTKKQ